MWFWESWVAQFNINKFWSISWESGLEKKQEEIAYSYENNNHIIFIVWDWNVSNMQSNKMSGKAKLPNVKKIINFPQNKTCKKKFRWYFMSKKKKNTLKSKLLLLLLLSHFSCVPLLATPWTAAHQAPPSMGFSRQDKLKTFRSTTYHWRAMETMAVTVKAQKATVIFFFFLSLRITF